VTGVRRLVMAQWRWCVAVVICPAVFALFWWAWEALKLPPAWPDRRAVALSVAGAVATAVGLPLASWAGHDRPRDSGRDEPSELKRQMRVFNEHFTAIVAQLGAAQAEVRLAGVHAMAGLADDWEENRQTCVDVLCAYPRMPYGPDPGEDAAAVDRLSFRASREIRHTVIRLISSHLRNGAAVSWQGLNFDFAGTAFDGGDFGGAVFSGGTVNFGGAEFTCGKVNFGGAVFSGGTVNFDGAEFTGAEVNFGRALFSSGQVSFNGARFSRAKISFIEAEFSGGEVTFRGASFSGEYRRRRRLLTVNFSRARFSGAKVSFSEATFTGAVSFSEAEFSKGEVTFGGCRFDGIWNHVKPSFLWGNFNFNSARFCGAKVSFSDAEFSGATVSFRKAEFSEGTVSFRSARFSCESSSSWAPVSFSDAEFSGARVSFSDAEFSKGTVSFGREEEPATGGSLILSRGARFSGGEVSFSGAKFSGGTMNFSGAEFVGTVIDFGAKLSDTQFSGGTVDFSQAASWSRPPTFRFSGTPPPGVKLPATVGGELP
jgi:uncharacterized protein YjbI with pentapeptide repeats